MSCSHVPYLVMGLMISVGIATYFITRPFHAEIQTFSPDVWRALGEPGLNSASSFKAEIKYLRFIIGRHYKVLGNATIARLGDQLLICFIVNSSLAAMWLFFTNGGCSLLDRLM